MSGRIPARIARLCAASLTVLAVGAATAAAASAETVYDNVPATLPGNFASIGLAATSSSEFGGEIELAGAARRQPTITVVMSSWACESGSWTEPSACLTPKPRKTFKVPLTVKVYAADELNEGPIGEVTKSIKMHYRPSDSASCPSGEQWYDAATSECFHGYAFPVSLTLKKLKKMPQKAVVTFSYPHSSGPAESLNISVSEPEEHTLSVGSDPVEEWFANSTWSGMYCPGATDVGQLGPEQGVGCAAEESGGVNYQPVISVSAN
ncbi:MAG TPA: hypothetical protein VL979_01310 [Solirubrobacteraceae bacterium]|nr:hypothetical protein [Solirubrobacteraceae bacterium]